MSAVTVPIVVSPMFHFVLFFGFFMFGGLSVSVSHSIGDVLRCVNTESVPEKLSN